MNVAVFTPLPSVGFSQLLHTISAIACRNMASTITDISWTWQYWEILFAVCNHASFVNRT